MPGTSRGARCAISAAATSPAQAGEESGGGRAKLTSTGGRGLSGVRRIARKGGSMRLVLSLAAGASLTLGLVSISLGHQGTKPPPKTIPCDVCNGKMNLTDHKTKTNTQEVKIKGKSYWCCAGCDMSKSKLVDKKPQP